MQTTSLQNIRYPPAAYKTPEKLLKPSTTISRSCSRNIVLSIKTLRTRMGSDKAAFVRALVVANQVWDLQDLCAVWGFLANRDRLRSPTISMHKPRGLTATQHVTLCSVPLISTLLRVSTHALPVPSPPLSGHADPQCPPEAGSDLAG